MHVSEIIKRRRSITAFKDIPLTQDQWMKIIEAATFAPNAGNVQDWRFIVVDDAKKRENIAHACHGQVWLKHAPLHIVCCSDTERMKRFYGTRGERLYSVQNVAAAAQNMLLAATEMGLGSCWAGAFEEKDIRASLGIPDQIRVHAVLAFGYPNEVRPTPQRQPLHAFCFLNHWENKLQPNEWDEFNYNYAKIAQSQTKATTNFVKSVLKRIFK